MESIVKKDVENRKKWQGTTSPFRALARIKQKKHQGQMHKNYK